MSLAVATNFAASSSSKALTTPYPSTEKPARVFAAVKDMCEWRLGRRKLGDPEDKPGAPIAVSALVACLRRVQKSIRLWNKEGGRKGYLDFVSQYIR